MTIFFTLVHPEKWRSSGFLVSRLHLHIVMGNFIKAVLSACMINDSDICSELENADDFVPVNEDPQRL